MTVHFASLMDLCHLKSAELKKKHQKYKGRDVLRDDIVNDDSDSCAVLFKETIQNARKKLETLVAPAMPCKTSKKGKHWETRGITNDFKSKFACILEASESTRLRMEESLPTYHEDHISGKGDNSLQHYNLVHKFIPMLQPMKITAGKAAVDK